jgi:hypothetical protein
MTITVLEPTAGFYYEWDDAQQIVTATPAMYFEGGEGTTYATIIATGIKDLERANLARDAYETDYRRLRGERPENEEE